MNNKYTLNDYISKCEELNDDFVGTRKHAHKGTIIDYVCRKHKDKGIQSCDWSHFKTYKNGCPYCSGRYKTTQDILPLIKDKNIELLSEYLGNEKPIDCICKVCGYKWTTLPKVLITNGSGCPKCAIRIRSEKSRKSNQKFLEDLKSLNPYLIPKTEYITSKTKMKFECLIDNTIFEAIPSNVLNGNTRCPTCSKQIIHDKLAYSTEEFNDKIKYKNIKLEEAYESMHIPTKFHCLKCDRIFTSLPSSLLYKNSDCPYCGGTQGERLLNSELERIGCQCKSQYIFEDCRYINPLRFDFYDEKHNIAFEYNGEQHYYPIDFSGKGKEHAQKELKVAQKRDNIKINYCKQHNIPLIIIPYWEKDNIHQYIKTEFERNGIDITKLA